MALNGSERERCWTIVGAVGARAQASPPAPRREISSVSSARTISFLLFPVSQSQLQLDRISSVRLVSRLDRSPTLWTGLIIRRETQAAVGDRKAVKALLRWFWAERLPASHHSSSPRRASLNVATGKVPFFSRGVPSKFRRPLIVWTVSVATYRPVSTPPQKLEARTS